MPSLSSLVLVASFAFAGRVINDTECAINIPGYVHHGNCNLLCRPASWTDLVVFFLGNYVAHAATIISRPGQSTLMAIINVLAALFFPGASIYRGMGAIFTQAVFAPTALQRAARAGALCMVVKDLQAEIELVEGAPNAVDGPDIERQAVNSNSVPGAVRGATSPPLRPKQEPISLVATKIHGVCKLPKGYSLMVLPGTAKFEDDPDGATSIFKRQKSEHTIISSSYNLIKIFISAGQLLFATGTLYVTRGDQVSNYGYAAFGLTVVQYAWMSFINLLGNWMCPQYNTLFLVESETLADLRREIAAQGKENEFPISGAVGEVTSETEQHVLGTANFTDPGIVTIFSYLGMAVPFIIVGILSRFSMGSSGLYQRVWIMVWLVFGSVTGPGTAVTLENSIEPRPILSGLSTHSLWPMLFAAAIYAVPAIGGFVVVGQMITQYGSCFEL